MKGPSPLLGYNTNVRHAGKLYHIQTEDSGVRHPHVITHLFADGGRIIASKKTTYTEHVGAEDYQKTVKQIMRGQHKDMFIALRDGVYDEEEAPGPSPVSLEDSTETLPGAVAVRPGGEVEIDLDVEIEMPPVEPAARPMDLDALDAAAAAFDDMPGTGEHERPPKPASPGLYQSLRPAVEVAGRATTADSPDSIFGSDLLSEKSLDEVILSYLAEDLEETDG